MKLLLLIIALCLVTNAAADKKYKKTKKAKKSKKSKANTSSSSKHGSAAVGNADWFKVIK